MCFFICFCFLFFSCFFCFVLFCLFFFVLCVCVCFSVRNCQPAFYLSVSGFFCKKPFSVFLDEFKFIYIFNPPHNFSRRTLVDRSCIFWGFFFVFSRTELSTSFLFIHHWRLQKVFFFFFFGFPWLMQSLVWRFARFLFSFRRNKIRRRISNWTADVFWYPSSDFVSRDQFYPMRGRRNYSWVIIPGQLLQSKLSSLFAETKTKMGRSVTFVMKRCLSKLMVTSLLFSVWARNIFLEI